MKTANCYVVGKVVPKVEMARNWFRSIFDIFSTSGRGQLVSSMLMSLHSIQVIGMYLSMVFTLQSYQHASNCFHIRQ